MTLERLEDNWENPTRIQSISRIKFEEDKVYIEYKQHGELINVHLRKSIIEGLLNDELTQLTDETLCATCGQLTSNCVTFGRSLMIGIHRTCRSILSKKFDMLFKKYNTRMMAEFV